MIKHAEFSDPWVMLLPYSYKPTRAPAPVDLLSLDPASHPVPDCLKINPIPQLNEVAVGTFIRGLVAMSHRSERTCSYQARGNCSMDRC